jgi:hypothetical protein
LGSIQEILKKDVQLESLLEGLPLQNLCGMEDNTDDLDLDLSFPRESLENNDPFADFGGNEETQALKPKKVKYGSFQTMGTT